MALPGTWGMGSPDSIPGVATPLGTFFDWGFGDPEPSSWGAVGADFGFGDPPQPDMAVVPYIVPVAPDQPFPDDGGVLCTLEASWANALPSALGPYRVRLIDAVGQYWPDAAGCYSALQGQGPKCQTNLGKTALRFAIPPVPPGVYDIEVAWGPDYGDSVKMVKGLRIVLRGRNLYVRNLRSQNFPKPFAVGARSAMMESIVGLPEGV